MRLARIKKLGVSDEEALEILAYDKQVEQTKESERLEYDLTKEQEAIAKKFKRTNSNVSTGKRNRVAKEDPTKEGVISAIAEFLRNDIPVSDVTDVEITNKTREILFKIAGDYYSVVMARKTKMNKK